MGKNKTHGTVKKGKHTSGGSGNRAVVYLGCAKYKHDEIKTSRDISDVEGRRRRGAQVDNNERYEISLAEHCIRANGPISRQTAPIWVTGSS